MAEISKSDEREQTRIIETYTGGEEGDGSAADKTIKAEKCSSPSLNMSSLAENVLELFNDENFQDKLKPTMIQMMSEFINKSVAHEMEGYKVEELLESNKILVEMLENKHSLIEHLTAANGQYESDIKTLMSLEKRLMKTFMIKGDSDAATTYNDLGTRPRGQSTGTAIETEQQERVIEVESFHGDTSSTDTVGYPKIYKEDKFIESTWRNLADQEIDEGKKEGVGKRRGTHAVLCIDTSGSMNEGNAWSQVKQFYKAFLDGMDELKDQDAHYDNIAVVTFGKETKVQRRLTKNLKSLRGILDDITPEGPSPIFGGLVMAAAAAQTSEYKLASVNYMQVRPKIIMVTDGRPTELSLDSGPDKADSKKLEQTRNAIFDEVAKLTKEKIDLHCIYVGENADRTFLRSLQSEGVKELMSYRDGEKMAWYTVLKCMREGDQRFVRCAGEDDVMRSQPSMPDAEQLLAMMKMLTEQMPGQGTSSAGDLSEFLGMERQGSPKAPIPDFGRRTGYKTSTITIVGDRVINVYKEIHDQKHPSIGTRVERGDDWIWGDQDDGRAGTIIGHATDLEDDDGQCWVHVEWDDDSSPEKGRQNVYRYKTDEDMEEDVRETAVQDRTPPPGKVLAVGCRVKPGEKFKEDRANKEGTVIRFHKNRAEIRWDDGTRGRYGFGSPAAEIVLMMDPERTANPNVRKGGNKYDVWDVPKVTLTEKYIPRIAQTMSSGWQAVGTELGLTNVQMGLIMRDFRKSIVNQIVQMLSIWKRKPENTTLDVLVESMVASGATFDKDLLRNIISEIRQENESQ
ncbi:uncharacterized protein LOC128550611 [Mercenaria mercenaria]|uniref:uncharacterized protein LOC128550611 n=1 Tax=Mercenaria mercenaria TaxID=6596 RepID=UPI00234E9F00|nr:uncharacterized protein LOC128550611 [Mercenaria mercenaria]XP_053385887.1 uncharacterized protein LOC128550611 [Mercenaria mercenaria]XP_053385888.1 uncharacterized protein LOC128550611 [Mercenaria mercenaria]XP_053385889.1 uncharacterized protein LOC128550611 [Mercenaria mercenaria]